MFISIYIDFIIFINLLTPRSIRDVPINKLLNII